MKTDAIFQMPDINDESAIQTHRNAVLAVFAKYFGNIDEALEEALPKVLNIFRLLDGPVDLAVHAPNTRYLVKQFLSARATPSLEEDIVDIDMQRVSNCGLCAKTPKGTIRILKGTTDGLPKAASEARQKFSTANQMTFRFDPNEKEPKLQNLNLFVLWRMDAEHTYRGMQIALPRRVREDGTIECYWVAEWRSNGEAAAPLPVTHIASDLDEIKALPSREKQNQ